MANPRASALFLFLLLAAGALPALAQTRTYSVSSSAPTPSSTIPPCPPNYVRDDCTQECKLYTDPTLNEDKDCQGTCFGTASNNKCGFCVGGATGLPLNYGINCADLCGTDYAKDRCEVCAPVALPDSQKKYIDCRGDCFGNYSLDSCGNCTSSIDPAGPLPNYLKDACNKCMGDNSTCTDCLGVVNGGAKLDNCNVCNGFFNSCIIVTSITPSAQPLLSSKSLTVLVFGAGFASAPAAQCNITNRLGSVSLTLPGTFVNISTVLCQVPSSAEVSPGEYTLTVWSVNGSFSESSKVLTLYSNSLAFAGPSIDDHTDNTPITITASGGSVFNTADLSVRFTDADAPALYTTTDVKATWIDATTIQVIPPSPTLGSVKFTMQVTLNKVNYIPSTGYVIYKAAAPVVSSAIVSDDNSFLTVTFDSPGAGSFAANTACSSFFTNADLGIGAVCTFPSPTSLRVTFGSGVSFIAPNSLYPKTPFAIGAFNQRYTKYLIDATVVSPPASPKKPALVLVGTPVSSCNDLELSWIVSNNPTSFVWNVVSLNGLGTGDIPNILAWLNANTTLYLGLVTVSKTLFTTSARLQFTLTVSTYGISSTPATSRVQVLTRGFPLAISLKGFPVYRSNVNQIQLKTQLGSCPLIPDINIKWLVADLTLGLDLDLTALGVVDGLATLSLPPFTLISTHTYSFDAVITSNSDPSIFGTVDQIVLEVASVALQGLVSGSKAIAATENPDTTLTCYDSDAVPGVDCLRSVTCLDESGVVCHSSSGPTPLAVNSIFEDTDSTTFRTLLALNYPSGAKVNMRGLVSKGSRTTTVSDYEITIRPVDAPTISNLVFLPATDPVPTTTNIRADFDVTSLTSYTVTWESVLCSGCNYVPNIAAVSCGTVSITQLCIKTSLLVPGSTYQFRATVTNAGGSSTISFTKIVAGVPYGGIISYYCYLDNIGTVVRRSCVIRYSNWKSADGLTSLSYETSYNSINLGTANPVTILRRSPTETLNIVGKIKDTLLNSFTTRSITVLPSTYPSAQVSRRDAAQDNEDLGLVAQVNLDDADSFISTKDYASALSIVISTSDDMYTYFQDSVSCADIPNFIASTERLVNMVITIEASIFKTAEVPGQLVDSLTLAPFAKFSCLSSSIQLAVTSTINSILTASTSKTFATAINSATAGGLEDLTIQRAANNLVNYARDASFASTITFLGKAFAIATEGAFTITTLATTNFEVQFSSVGKSYTPSLSADPTKALSYGSVCKQGGSTVSCGSLDLKYSTINPLYNLNCVGALCPRIIASVWTLFSTSPGAALPSIGNPVGAYTDAQLIDLSDASSLTTNFGTGLTLNLYRVIVTTTGSVVGAYLDLSSNTWTTTGVTQPKLTSGLFSVATTHLSVFSGYETPCGTAEFSDEGVCKSCDSTCATCNGDSDQDCLSCTPPRFLAGGNNCSLPVALPCVPLTPSPACTGIACYAILVIEPGYTCNQYTGPAGYSLVGSGTYCDVANDPACESYASCVDKTNGKTQYPNNLVCWFKAP